ncbi:DMSO/TMAO reductase YedYZ molybdopterin-dependent catalytic subunit [Tamaricihabitans halophyticus]|uniref:DMSO/TMAO reductase YedYZ molybdopterin-dependent catalytic subunit n=1 Tax=Tamaricihabitans halophyticus TaxID=1262583 RepID=A0A4R2Q8B2_9PSEU|nr:DMSO/TMAO reductase YedYZ molybdopterin-dependent catalytic subunit [Tamaricihabitans halophyticus]
MLSVGCGLAFGQLIAGLSGADSAPHLVVGNTMIDLTPEPVKAWAIRQFGDSDKAVLLAGMAVVIALLSACAGVIARFAPLVGSIIIATFGGLGVLAAVLRPDGDLVRTLPAITAVLVSLGCFAVLIRFARQEAGRAAAQTTAPNPARRRFLVTAATMAGLAGLAVAGGGLLMNRTGIEAARQRISGLLRANPPTPPGADFASDGTPTFITPNRDFYRVDTLLSVPRINPAEWRLRIHGMVDSELDVDFAELTARRSVSRTITMTCVSNEVGGKYVSTAVFTGVPLRELLAEAGVRSGAEQVFSTSWDGYTAGTPVEVLTDPDRDALLAYGMNGVALPAEHGFPVRMVTPGLYGYLSATKWVVDLELTTFDRQTYWEARGWATDAPIKVQSRIDRPAAFERLAPGPVTIAGVAWAQPNGIERVEVRVDGGTWRSAELSTEVNTHTWRMWRLSVELGPGGHSIECRATDKTGQRQTSRRVPPTPNGATGWHSVSCSVSQ